MKTHTFVKTVASLQFENCFNPYSDRCTVHDRWDAPKQRAAALSAILREASQQPVDAIWVGRDLGYRGGRRTGLALTDDVHMAHHAQRWQLQPRTQRPTKGAAIAERTAAVVWGMLEHIDARVFLWNVFPLHPHQPGDPFTNRQHRQHERCAGEQLLKELIQLLEPARIVAIGRDAESAAQRVVSTQPVISVRHPSYGGQAQFQRQIAELYWKR